MSLSHIPIASIEAADLQRLVENGVIESRTLDYKQEGVGGKEAERKEFLKDVSALANANGGDLVIGIQSKGGVPSAVLGITVANIDAEIQRLENMIRDNIEPRLIGHEIRSIPLE